LRLIDQIGWPDGGTHELTRVKFFALLFARTASNNAELAKCELTLSHGTTVMFCYDQICTIVYILYIKLLITFIPISLYHRKNISSHMLRNLRCALFAYRIFLCQSALYKVELIGMCDGNLHANMSGKTSGSDRVFCLIKITNIIRPHRMHAMRSIAIDDFGVCHWQSVCQAVSLC